MLDASDNVIFTTDHKSNIRNVDKVDNARPTFSFKYANFVSVTGLLFFRYSERLE